MALLEELELPSLDYTDPAMRGDRFHDAMRELREQAQAGSHGWLATGPFGYIVLDRESCEFFLRSRSAIFPGLKIAEIFDVTEGPLYEQMLRNILHVNGADHSRLRSLVNPALSPRAVERYRPVMREFLQELYAPVAGAGRCEFVEAFAKPYPSQMIAKVMGAPQEDAPRLHHWSNWIQRQFDAVSMAEQREQIEQAVDEFYRYATGLLHARRLSPGEDLISTLIAATNPDAANGENDRLSDVECVNLVFNVLAGGVDTTQSQLAHAIRLFSEHPDQWELLAAKPELAEQAVEEALRFEPITPFTARIVTEEIVYRDVVFPEGTIVMVCAFTGNRDLPDGAGDPECFDITVDRGGARALAFGAGVHYCLGANLARLELTEALTYLAPRMKGLCADGEPVYEGITGIYGLAELPIRFSTKK
ncbi:MAG TPA: cytochrome P450 [Solirubrobacteraceae bacterium]|nr:cytochrome P450 [Solirubrobacteraceae bacterium]